MIAEKMNSRQRAVRDEQKLERRQTILEDNLADVSTDKLYICHNCGSS